jgi:predicted DsbA family dithiol-disulfide isomerase
MGSNVFRMSGQICVPACPVARKSVWFVLLVLGVMFLWRPAIGFAEQDIVATVNGKAVSQDELNAAIRTQLDAINEQISALKQTALAKLIDNVLLQQAAEAEGISLEEYLSRDVEGVTVAPSEVDDAYERSKKQLPAVLPPEAKYRIRRSLEDTRRADALNALLQNLRRQADVRNFLLENISSNLDLAEAVGPSLGNPNAPVTVVVFADFECPFCRSAAPQLRHALELWSDKIRFVFKHFPLESHQHAFDMARGGVCAERAGAFWAFHDRVFQQESGLNAKQLTALAASMGLDPLRFSQCMASREVEQRIEKDIALGHAAGVSGTPTIFVNKRKLQGVNALDEAIQEALSKGAVAAKH